jgi:hypothetical protein
LQLVASAPVARTRSRHEIWVRNSLDMDFLS